MFEAAFKLAVLLPQLPHSQGYSLCCQASQSFTPYRNERQCLRSIHHVVCCFSELLRKGKAFLSLVCSESGQAPACFLRHLAFSLFLWSLCFSFCHEAAGLHCWLASFAYLPPYVHGPKLKRHGSLSLSLSRQLLRLTACLLSLFFPQTLI